MTRVTTRESKFKTGDKAKKIGIMYIVLGTILATIFYFIFKFIPMIVPKLGSTL
jgi:hypothetical protein